MPAKGAPEKRVAIIAAMGKETRPFLDELEGAEEVSVLGPTYAGPALFRKGTMQGSSCMLVTSGIGTTNAAIAAAGVLSFFRPDLVVVAGTAGGLGRQVGAGDVVIADFALYHEADASAFGYAPGQIPRMPETYQVDPDLKERAERALREADLTAWVGGVGSSNSFVTADHAEDLRKLFPDLLAVDMETAAIAQACHLFRVPWVSLRAVSDLCEPDGAGRFRAHAPEAAETSKTAATAFLQTLTTRH